MAELQRVEDESRSPLLARDVHGNSKDTRAAADDDAGRSTPRFMWLFVPLVACGGLLFGFDTGVVSGALVKITEDLNLSSTEQELVVSLTVAGAVVGAALGSFVADTFGRRPVILVSSTVFTGGAFAMGMAPSLAVLLAGRAIVGVGIGLASMVVPLYLAEVAPKRHRGMLVTLNVVFITGGQVLASVVAGGFADVHEGWRWMLGLSGVPSGVQLVGFLFMPESPRWLVMKQRPEEAMSVLRRTRGAPVPTTVPTDEEDAFEAGLRQELFDMRQAVQEGAEQLTVVQLLGDASLRRSLTVGAALQAVQQFAGINLVMYYSGSLLRAAGFASSAAIWLAAAVAAVNFVFSIAGMALVDRMGRRPLTLWSLGAVVLALGFLGGVFYGRNHASATCVPYHAPGVLLKSTATLVDCQAYDLCVDCVADSGCGFWGDATTGICLPGNSTGPRVPVSPSHSATWNMDTCQGMSTWSALSVVGLMLYLVCFAPGMGNMPWTINAEIYPQHARAAGNSITAMVNWVCNFIVSMTFLGLQKTITPYGTFWMYGGMAALGWLFFYRRLPETKGVGLEDTAALFH